MQDVELMGDPVRRMSQFGALISSRGGHSNPRQQHRARLYAFNQISIGLILFCSICRRWGPILRCNPIYENP